MSEFAHLQALRIGLLHESARLRAARKPEEISLRKAWVAQKQREIADEIAFLAKRGIVEAPLSHMSDEELLSELSS